jgi:hypothetical protein
MKKLFILVFVIAAGYIFYSYFYNEEVVEIEENIVVTQASGMDINASPSPPPKYASIEGVIKNIGSKNLTDIVIIYTVGYDTLKGIVGFLKPGETAEFKTSSCRVRGANPDYSLEEITYDDD